MVDVFGGSSSIHGLRGPRGPPGPSGESGSIKDLCAWMPNTVLKNLRDEDESGCYLLNDTKKDIKRNKKGEIVEWTSRCYKKFNLVAKRPCKDLILLPDEQGYALDFHKSVYTANEIIFMGESGQGYVCITFRTSSDREQSLIGNHNNNNPTYPFNEISATSTEILIRGAQDGKSVYVSIQHSCREWTTLFIEWITTPDKIHGSYIINNDIKLFGTFTFDTFWVCRIGIDVGGRDDNTHFLTGAISALEIYSSLGDYNRGGLPQALKDLMIKNQMIEDEDSSPAKKRKYDDKYIYMWREIVNSVYRYLLLR